MFYHDSCGALIKQIHDKIEKQANNEMREDGLTLMQCHVLMLLDAADDRQMPLKEVERQLQVAQSTAAGIVSRLEQKGLVEGLDDAEDRRIKLVHLTPRGAEYCRRAESNMHRADERLLSELTAEERETLQRLLKKVSEHL